MATKRDCILDYCIRAGTPLTARQIVEALYPGKQQPYVNADINLLVSEGKLIRTSTRPYCVLVPAVCRIQEEKQVRASTPCVLSPGQEVCVPSLQILGYTFSYLQDIAPERDADGALKEYRPQSSYRNKNGIPLSEYGSGAFCRFSLYCGSWRGVYILVSDGEIIYIGETVNLHQRFNRGYGRISPRNCYLHGQSTNCRINKIVLDHYRRGKTIQVYFLKTDRNKQIEKDLLGMIHPRYNIQHF